MNRIIKYRVWDTRQNKYLHPDTVSISGSGIMSFAGTGGKYHTITQPSDDPSPRFIIEQDTGLKDKNGNAIYEGDIVDCVKKGTEDTDVKRATIESVINYWDSVWLYDEITIIGNIHENPELLEEK